MQRLIGICRRNSCDVCLRSEGKKKKRTKKRKETGMCVCVCACDIYIYIYIGDFGSPNTPFINSIWQITKEILVLLQWEVFSKEAFFGVE